MYKNIIEKSGLFKLVADPTPVNENSSTIIDHVVTNNKSIECKVQHTPKISDHSIININIDQNHYAKNQFISIVKRQYRM